MNFKDINDIEEAIEILVRVMRRNESFSSPEEVAILKPLLDAIDKLADIVDVLEKPFFNPKNNHPHYKLIQN
jgi:hypothetical protein